MIEALGTVAANTSCAGHDFAVLQQETSPLSSATFSPWKHLVNPPRRDVVLLPKGGFVVIAFKTDNIGTWLVHCHIGMGLQT